MPRIAEIKVENNEVWVKIQTREFNGEVQLWTAEELKQHDYRVIVNFLNEKINEVGENYAESC